MATFVNNTASTQVLLATFDKNWTRQNVSDGHVIYTATSNRATVELVIRGTRNQRLTFSKGRRIFVVDGTFHFPPHTRVIL